MSFTLHPQLAADSELLCRLTLCQVRLMNDARFAWLLLVPERANLRDMHNLPAAEQTILQQEICQASAALEAVTNAHKINVAALGNMVPQLHVHVIARQIDDAAWPGPVWGVGQAEPWQGDAQAALTQPLLHALTANTAQPT